MNLALAAVVVCCAVAVRWFTLISGRAALRRRGLPQADALFRKFFSTPLFVFPAVLALELFSSLFEVPGHFRAALNHAINVAFVASATWFALRLVGFIERYLYQLYDVNSEDNFRQRRALTQIGFVSKTLMAGIVFCGVAGVLFTFKEARNLGASLLASAGILSVVIGFAAQKSLGNFIAGFQIAFTQPIRIDDVVIVEKEWGRIEEITLTYVVVKLWDLRRLVLPITYFVEKPFENWTRTSADVMQTIFFYVDFRSDVAAIRAAFAKFVAENSRWDKKVAVLQVTELQSNEIQLRGLVSARNASLGFDLRCEVRERLLRWIREEHPDWLPRHRATLTSDA